MLGFRTITLSLLLSSAIGMYAGSKDIIVDNLGNEHNFVHINSTSGVLLLPIEDAAPEGEVNFVSKNANVLGYTLKVRLAREKVDYYLPVDLSFCNSEPVKMFVNGVPSSSVCWNGISLSDTFDKENTEKFIIIRRHTDG